MFDFSTQICGKNYREELGKLVAPDQLLPSLGGTCTFSLSDSFGPWTLEQKRSLPDPHLDMELSDALQLRAVSQLPTSRREKRSSLEAVSGPLVGDRYRDPIRRRRCEPSGHESIVL